jgi:hypothetical protein
MMHNANLMNGQVSDANAVAQSEIRPAYAQLKPKSACWYCNQPLDNVRRFCGKACADDYRTEEALTMQEREARADSVDQTGSRTGT